MPDYSKNFLTSMTGYVNMNDPEDPKPKAYIPQLKTSLDTTADVRDILSNIVGSNYSSWQDFSANEDAKARYGALINKVGRPLATKLVTQAIIFNQRPDTQNQNLEQKIQSFYNIGATDKEVAGVLQNVKSFGYGVVPRISGNPFLQGKSSLQRNVSSPAGSPIQSKKIKEIVKTKTKLFLPLNE